MAIIYKRVKKTKVRKVRRNPEGKVKKPFCPHSIRRVAHFEIPLPVKRPKLPYAWQEKLRGPQQYQIPTDRSYTVCFFTKEHFFNRPRCTRAYWEDQCPLHEKFMPHDR